MRRSISTAWFTCIVGASRDSGRGNSVRDRLESVHE